MKNWPKPELSYFERLNIKLTKNIFQFALKKERRNGLLKRFYMEAQHQQSSTDITSSNVVQFPSDLALEEIVYYDIYPIEEIGKLEKGLSKIIQKNRWPKGSFGYVLDRTNQSTEYLKNAQKFKYKGGNTNAGSAYFAENVNFELVDSVRIWIATITPSYVCLILIASPSDSFKKKFYQISKESEDIETKITFPNIKFGLSNIRNWHRFGHSNRNIIDPKHRKLDELFLKGNKEIVKCLRKHIKAGMAMRRPIPQVEVISTKEPLDKIPTDIYRNDESELEKQFNEYLKYVGYNSIRLKPYTNNKANLYKAYRSQYYNLSAYQILTNLDGDEKEDAESDQNTAFYNLSYLYPYLCTTLSIQEYLKFISDSLFDLNKRISRILDKETSKGIGLRGFKKNISKTAKIKWLKFQQLRLWSELMEFETFPFLKKRMEIFEREKYRHEEEKEEKINFVDGINRNVTRIKESNERNFNFIEEADDQILKLKNIVITNRLQLTVAGLTFVLLVFTFLLLPSDLLQKIWSYLNNIIK